MSAPNDGIITSTKDFSGSLTLDLTDDEISRAYRVIVRIKTKWEGVFRKKFPFDSLDQALDLLSQFDDEIKTELAEQCNILATVDTTPILEGQPPVIEWIGKLPGDDIYKEGLDHERKEYEVKRAHARGEAFYGEKEAKSGDYAARDRRNNK